VTSVRLHQFRYYYYATTRHTGRSRSRMR